jgi:Na+:H+ antiporter, NhaA family
MRTTTSSRHLASSAAATHPSPGEVIAFLSDRFLWLPIGALVAVLWANLAPERYFPFAHALAFPVNEIGMALFLALIVHEAIDAVGPSGVLRHWQAWTLSLVAAAGGIAGAAFAFLGFVTWKGELVLAQAWPVAAAVDIAAGYYVLRLIYRRGSPVFPFLLLTGIAVNAVGLVVLAVWPAFGPDHVTGAILVLAAVGLAGALRAAGLRRSWPFLLFAGPLSWWGFHLAGVHPALALVPIVPLLPPSRHLLEPFAARRQGAATSEETSWLTLVQVVLFFFGLVNAGVMLRGYDTGTWAVLLGALAGRPAGMMAAVALGRLTGLRLPASIGWRDVLVVGLATSSGFTFALFTAATLLPVGGVLTQIRAGALATAVGAAIAYGVARQLRVGRFATRHAAH